ncbi:type II secretion system protein GspL [Serratia sp. L9]|uniref:type II secretion system protein GspL n=1 Tax=Serratia sp. L9 TaxID=3423946 RepID=UPI003D6732E7
MNRLIIALGTEQESILWCWGNPAEEQCQLQGALSAGESLPPEVSAAPVMVLVPGQRIVLRTVPFQGAPRLATAQALAFQCEEDLLEDVDELHWVILGNEGTRYALAGYRRSDMQNWLALLTSLGIRPTIMLPDVLAFPFNGRPTMQVLRDYVLFRHDKWSGYCLPQQWSLAQPDPRDQDQAATCVADLWQCASVELDKHSSLLQGEFAAAPQWRTSACWRYCLGLSLALGALAMGSFHYHQQTQALHQQIDQIHTQLFSGEKTPEKPLAVIKARIRMLQQNQQQAQFFELGQQLHQALLEQYQQHAHRLIFDAQNAELTLTLKTGQVQPFDHSNEQGNQVSLHKIAGENASMLTVKETP